MVGVERPLVVVDPAVAAVVLLGDGLAQTLVHELERLARVARGLRGNRRGKVGTQDSVEEEKTGQRSLEQKLDVTSRISIKKNGEADKSEKETMQYIIVYVRSFEAFN